MLTSLLLVLKSLLKLVLVIPASSEVQGGAPTVPLPSVAIKIATDYLFWTRTFSNVAFVSSSVYLSLMYFKKKCLTVWPSVENALGAVEN